MMEVEYGRFVSSNLTQVAQGLALSAPLPIRGAMSTTLELTQDLIGRNSVTPVDAGCQQVMGDRLTAVGFRRVAALR